MEFKDGATINNNKKRGGQPVCCTTSRDIMVGARCKVNVLYFMVTCLIVILVLGRALDKINSNGNRAPNSSGQQPSVQHHLHGKKHGKFHQRQKVPTAPTVPEVQPLKPPEAHNPLFQMESADKNAVTNLTMDTLVEKIQQEIFNSSDSEYLTFRDYQTFKNRMKLARGEPPSWSHKPTSGGFIKEPECNTKRRQQIKDVCKGMDHLKPVAQWKVKDVRKNIKRLSNIIVDDKHKLLFCEIPKTGCTSWKVAISLLTGRVRKMDIMNRNYLAVHARYYMARLGLYYLSDVHPKSIRKKLKRYYKFLVVRHPLDRLVSAYTDKFLNQDPYFKWYDDMKKQIKARYRDDDADQNATISFREFVNYAADPDSTPDRHWLDYQHLCGPCVVDYDYVVKVESMEQDARYLLPKISKDPELGSLPEAHSHRSAEQARRPYKELREFFNVTKQETQRLIDGPYKYDFPMFGYRFDAETGRATCDEYTEDGQCC